MVPGFSRAPRFTPDCTTSKPRRQYSFLSGLNSEKNIYAIYIYFLITFIQICTAKNINSYILIQLLKLHRNLLRALRYHTH
jgi:hypothetical protein